MADAGRRRALTPTWVCTMVTCLRIHGRGTPPVVVQYHYRFISGIGSIAQMTKHAHRFVEDYHGFIGFGLDRASDENTLIVYLQKISDDTLAQTLVPRLTDTERQELFDILTRLLKTHLDEDEYHRLFLKDR